jgi:subtilisin family serine protease
MPEPSTDVREYDPVLAEASRVGDADDTVSIIARVSDVSALPPGVQVITRFGDVVTLRARRAQIPALAETAAVLEMEASTPLRPSWEQCASDRVEGAEDSEEDDGGTQAGSGDPGPAAYVRRPAGLTTTGRGVVVAVIDWGCDFAHPAFRNEDGSTRLIAIWDQRGAAGSGPENRWGYGRILTSVDIDRALSGPRPYQALGYDPADAEPPAAASGDDVGTHGSHVLDIAAGNGRGGGEVGVAPEAGLVFVHLAGTADVLGRHNLGDSVTVLEALDFVFAAAGDRPCVVNMSVGAHGGPHDGSTLVEQGIDRAVWLARGRVVVNSAGNYLRARAHAQGRLRPGGEAELRFSVPPDDPTASELELWYAGADRFEVTVVGPGGTDLARVTAGSDAALTVDGREVGHVYHVRQAGNREHQVDLFLRPHAPGGEWALRLKGEVVEDGRYHAWIERDRGPSPRFAPPSAVPTTTTGTLCNGRLSIAVGAYDPHHGRRLGAFSSAGPTRDGRLKPEIVAPGVRIGAARSTPAGEAPDARYTTKSGTSMAAPHVTGTVALMCEAAGQPLDIADVRALLFTTAEPAAPAGHAASADLHRFGHGYLDIVAAERAAARWAGARDESRGAAVLVTPEGHVEQETTAMDDTYWNPPPPEELPPASTPSAPLHGESLLYAASLLGAIQRPEQFLQLALSSAGVGPEHDLEPVGSPAAPLTVPVQRGDLMVRTVPSPSRVHSAVVLAAPEPAETLRARGVPVEFAGRGTYVEVMEVPFGGGSPRVVGRRLTDAWGRVPRGEAVLRPVPPGRRWDGPAPAPFALDLPSAPDLPSTTLPPVALEMPGEQQVAQIDWCRMRQTIASNARTEEARWTGPTGTKLLESQASQRPFLVSYWMTVPGFTTAAAAGAQAALSAADTLGAEWSAAFICFVMHASGIRPAHGFVFGPRHMTYVVGALRNREASNRDRPFWLVDRVELRVEATPQPGDLLCFNRPDENGVMSTHTFESLRQQWVTNNPNADPTGRSHCALVLGTVQQGNQTFLQTIGGNETHSVRLAATIPVDANGGIVNAAAHDIFGMIKITRC